ncbi:MAG TPA: DRTGG domain-containing protein [Sphaerochaeta sp.]|nr:DRTGG domain-containing protein [Sphaerochaeta sp.]
MKLKDILSCVNAKLVCGEEHLEDTIKRGFASDLMSDVLTILEDDIILITGLSNVQAIRTAVMSDIQNILLVRNKVPSPAMIEMANEFSISLSYTPYSLFRASGLLYAAGLNPVY